MFYVEYLPIKGLSLLSYSSYDERHVPERFRRPHGESGIGEGSWEDRPDHDKSYPDIAVPIELRERFDIEDGESQMIWVDIYIPRDAPAGLYRGSVVVSEAGQVSHRIPVFLQVWDFTLPQVPHLKTAVHIGYADINERYLGEAWPTDSKVLEHSRLIRDRHYQVAHRHRISLIDEDTGTMAWGKDSPRPEWVPRIDGSLFTSQHGYAGPGEGTGNGIYVVGTYGSWPWKGSGESAMRQHTDAWAEWFRNNAPGTENFLYLIDESRDYQQIEKWARSIEDNPGPGRALPSMATISAPDAVASTPSLDIIASWMTVGDSATWADAVTTIQTSADKQLLFYNGNRPATGSFAIEDDGVALRALAWTQFKHTIDRWFYWEATYYRNYQAGLGPTNVFKEAATFGGRDSVDASTGETGWNHSNGDGVLLYPGTDQLFPDVSLGIAGPVASLRLKLWRRGVQDGDYLAMATGRDPDAVDRLMKALLPTTMWEHGVSDPADPTWVRAGISWPTDPDAWELARWELARIITSTP